MGGVFVAEEGEVMKLTQFLEDGLPVGAHCMERGHNDKVQGVMAKDPLGCSARGDHSQWGRREQQRRSDNVEPMSVRYRFLDKR